MEVRHGRKRYSMGCRCDECRTAQRLYQRRYRERVANGLTRPQVVTIPPATADLQEPVPVESAVEAEVGALAQERPTLVAIATAMARILDSSRAASAQPAAAKVLVSVMDALHKGSAQRRGRLALVKSMTEKGGA